MWIASKQKEGNCKLKTTIAIYASDILIKIWKYRGTNSQQEGLTNICKCLIVIGTLTELQISALNVNIDYERSWILKDDRE